METNDKRILTTTDRNYLNEIVETIKVEFQIWTDKIYEHVTQDGVEEGFDYRKLLSPELKQALIGIQRIKPEVLQAADIDQEELVRNLLAELLDCHPGFVELLQIEECDIDECESSLTPFVRWFEEQTFWKVTVYVLEGRCENSYCCCRCLQAEVECAEATLIPASELFAFEEDPYKSNEFRHLLR